MEESNQEKPTKWEDHADKLERYMAREKYANDIMNLAAKAMQKGDAEVNIQTADYSINFTVKSRK